MKLLPANVATSLTFQPAEPGTRVKCVIVKASKRLLPGWGCCKCATYNGLQRDRCKRCQHECCVPKPRPSEFGLCDVCGVPEGYEHVGHTGDRSPIFIEALQEFLDFVEPEPENFPPRIGSTPKRLK